MPKCKRLSNSSVLINLCARSQTNNFHLFYLPHILHLLIEYQLLKLGLIGMSDIVCWPSGKLSSLFDEYVVTADKYQYSVSIVKYETWNNDDEYLIKVENIKSSFGWKHCWSFFFLRLETLWTSEGSELHFSWNLIGNFIWQ